MSQKTKQTSKHQHKNMAQGKAQAKAKKNNSNLFNWLLITGLLTLIAFWPSFKNEFTNWDDSGYVLENQLIKHLNWDGIKAIFTTYVQGNYHPLTILTYAFEYHFSELNPGIYHFTCTCIHILNALLVCYFVFLITKNPLIAGITAILFGIHPMHVESVAWVSELKDVQYTFFYFASLIFYLYYVSRPTAKLRNYIVSLFLFLLSLFSKGQAVTLPLVMLLADLFLERERNRKLLMEKIPFFLLSVTFGIVAIYAQKASEAIQDNQLFSFFERILFASYGMLVYLGKLFIPVKLSCFYPYPYKHEGMLPWIYYICPIIVLALLYGVYRSYKYTKVVAFGFLFFLSTIILVLQLLAVGSTIMAERYSYIPYVGIFFIIAYGFNYAWENKKQFHFITAGLLIVYSISLVFVTRAQCVVWKNSLNLWTNEIEHYPLVPVAHNNRGLYYKGLNSLDKALDCYNQALKADPSYQGTYENRGNIFFLTGKYDSAIVDFNHALKLKANSEVAFNSRGAVYFNEGKYDLAIADFNKAIKAKKDYPEAYRNRANAYSVTAQWEKALADYKVYLQYDTKLDMIYYWKAIAESNLHKYNEAIEDFSIAINRKPQMGDFYINRSRTYQSMGKLPEALADAENAKLLGVKVDEAYINSLRQSK